MMFDQSKTLFIVQLTIIGSIKKTLLFLTIIFDRWPSYASVYAFGIHI